MPSFSTILTTLVAFSASALAYTTPTTFNETSNPVFTPNSGDIVPVGKPYKITWGPTEKGTVSIILLRGPSKNILPLYPIAEEIPNSGSYTWTPKTDLEDDTSEYGIQIIIDANGQYQYSTQFGISNPDYVPSSTSGTASATTSEAEPTTTSYATVSITSKSIMTSLITVTTPAPVSNTTSLYTPTYTPTTTSNYTATYTPPGSSETSSAGESSSTSPAAPSQTGAATSVKVASGLLLGVAGVAALLF
ncbi:hypothetical protein ABW19_dt0202056 [Dactylella cylindrospora]|nr:hypothetical protein ABW19_dt0202056 [Dactylella cylindrospora]